MAPSFCYKSFNSSAISCNSLLNIFIVYFLKQKTEKNIYKI